MPQLWKVSALQGRVHAAKKKKREREAREGRGMIDASKNVSRKLLWIKS